MKKNLLYCIAFTIILGDCNSLIAQNTSENNEPIFTVCESPAEFAQGADSLQSFLTKNIVYPQSVIDTKYKGVALATFVVEKDGSLTDIKILHTSKDEFIIDMNVWDEVQKDLVKECLRVVKLLTKFKPALQRGHPVRYQYNLILRFN
jgi:Gram-negative bacterial tonB protein.